MSKEPIRLSETQNSVIDHYLLKILTKKNKINKLKYWGLKTGWPAAE